METITLTIDGKKIEAPKGSTVLKAALTNDIYIPTLCYHSDLSPYGACRICIVEIERMRGFPTACTTEAREGMIVWTDTEKINQLRRMTMEIIMANHPWECLTCPKNQDCELLKVARYLGMDQERFNRLRPRKEVLPVDNSNPAFFIDHNKCILCTRCVRACHEIAGIGALDVAFRGDRAKIATLGDKFIAESICVSCGECVARCPTGAMIPKGEKMPLKEVRSICPYCGIGCSIYLGTRGNEIVAVRGDEESPVNKGGLCVKGRFGTKFTNHTDRLTKPLIRKEGVSRDVEPNGKLEDLFREASWDEALDRVAQRLSQIKSKNGPDSIGVLSSAKATSEENYLAQKLARVVLGTNNIDHCARLCHASTVAGLAAAFGAGAATNSIADIAKADLLLVIGSNTTECHPIIGRIILQNVQRERIRLIVANPKEIELSPWASINLYLKPGTDVALLNGLMHVIIKENLQDEKFIQERTEGYEELARTVERYRPELVEEITGVPARDIVNAARLFANAERVCLLYAMGITQHVHGTDNVLSTANLLMLTGNIGREGTGLSPLRGQNNVQGACDVGALPNVFPGYQRVDNPEVRRKFEEKWKCALSEKPGLMATEMPEAARERKIKAMFIIGEDPLMSDPALPQVREGMKKLEFLVVQELFPTKTANMADVLLPAASFAEKEGTFTNTERRVQKIRKAVDPPGEAKPDWEIISYLTKKLGYSFNYKDTSEIMDEIASVTPTYGGISYARLEGHEGLQWPCPTKDHPGTAILHRESFTRGLGKFHGVEYKPPAEEVSEEYPLILTTGRVLEHWHGGNISRRTGVLEKLYPKGVVDIHPDDALKIGIKDGELVRISSRRGSVEVPARVTYEVSPGLCFLAFHWWEAPANELTIHALDSSGIPEFKVSAVKITKAG